VRPRAHPSTRTRDSRDGGYSAFIGRTSARAPSETGTRVARAVQPLFRRLNLYRIASDPETAGTWIERQAIDTVRL
jgi:hypothetical protein